MKVRLAPGYGRCAPRAAPAGYCLLLGIVAMWGGATALVGTVGRKEGGARNTVASTCLAMCVGMVPPIVAFPLLMAGGWRAFLRERPTHVRWAPLIVALTPLTSIGAFISYFLAVGGGLAVALVQTVSILSVGFPALYGVAVWSEKMPPKKAVGILGIMAGCALVGMGSGDDGSSGSTTTGANKGGAAVALAGATLCWGSGYIILSYTTRHLTSVLTTFWCILVASVVMLLVALVSVLVSATDDAFAIDAGEFFVMVGSQTLNYCGLFLYVRLSMEHEADGSMLAPLTQLYNVVPVAFAAIAYGEAITAGSGAGVALSVASAIGLSLAEDLVRADADQKAEGSGSATTSQAAVAVSIDLVAEA